MQIAQALTSVQHDLPHKCSEADCTAAYERAQALGVHKRQVHGIIGSSPSSILERKKKLQEQSNGTTTELTRKRPSELPVAAHQRKQARVINDPVEQGMETAIAIALGAIEGICRSLAYQFDLPERLLAQGVAESHYAQTIRGVHRNPVHL